MKKILLSIIVLLFLAAGLAISFLYSLGDKVIEESILEYSELESSAYESVEEETAPEIEPAAVKPEAEADKSAKNDIKDNNALIVTKKNDIKQNKAAPSNVVSAYIPQAQEEKESPVALESVNETKNRVPISEEASLTKLLLTKLTKKDISELKGMLSNGITSEEKRRAKEILYSRLTTEDINRIKDAYIKYTQQK